MYTRYRNNSFGRRFFFHSHTHLIFVCVYEKRRRLRHTRPAARILIGSPGPLHPHLAAAHARSPRSVCFRDNTPAGANYENYNAFAAADCKVYTHTHAHRHPRRRPVYIIICLYLCCVCVCVCGPEHQRDARNSFNNIIYIYIWRRLLCFIIIIIMKKCMWRAACVCNTNNEKPVVSTCALRVGCERDVSARCRRRRSFH